MRKRNESSTKNSVPSIFTFAIVVMIIVGAFAYMPERYIARTAETVDIEENEEEFDYENIPLTIENNLDKDITAIYIRMSDTNEWSENLIGDGNVIEDTSTVSGLAVSYSYDEHYIDIVAYDSDGYDIELNDIKLPTKADEMTLVLEYNAKNNNYDAFVV